MGYEKHSFYVGFFFLVFCDLFCWFCLLFCFLGFFFFFFEMGSYCTATWPQTLYVDLASLKFATALLPLPPKCWDYMCEPLCPTEYLNFNYSFIHSFGGHWVLLAAWNLLCRPCWPCTQRYLLASSSLMLGLKLCATTTSPQNTLILKLLFELLKN